MSPWRWRFNLICSLKLLPIIYLSCIFCLRCSQKLYNIWRHYLKFAYKKNCSTDSAGSFVDACSFSYVVLLSCSVASVSCSIIRVNTATLQIQLVDVCCMIPRPYLLSVAPHTHCWSPPKQKRGYAPGYDTIRDAILTYARKPTWVGLIYRTETTTKNCKTEKLKSKNSLC